MFLFCFLFEIILFLKDILKETAYFIINFIRFNRNPQKFEYRNNEPTLLKIIFFKIITNIFPALIEGTQKIFFIDIK